MNPSNGITGAIEAIQGQPGGNVVPFKPGLGIVADAIAHNMRTKVTRASAIEEDVATFVLNCPQLQVPAGELTLVAGREGTGKSQCSAGWAAGLTLGTLPGDSYRRPRSVIICAREDSWAKTIRPRLAAAGADLDRVLRVEVENIHSGKSFELMLPDDLEELEKTIRDYDVGMVILDPLVSVLSSRYDTHKASEVRHALEPLAGMAHRTGCAFIGLAHFAKMEGRDAASLISGSHAFKDVARAAIAFAMDSENTGIMSQVKNSLGPMPRQSLEYQIFAVDRLIKGQWVKVPVFYPGQPTDRHVNDLLDFGKAREAGKARDWLRGVLAGGPRLSRDVEEEAAANGISKRTLERARSDLRILPRKTPDGWVIGL